MAIRPQGHNGKESKGLLLSQRHAGKNLNHYQGSCSDFCLCFFLPLFSFSYCSLTPSPPGQHGVLVFAGLFSFQSFWQAFQNSGGHFTVGASRIPNGPCRWPSLHVPVHHLCIPFRKMSPWVLCPISSSFSF